jgi:hypothetical protein
MPLRNIKLTGIIANLLFPFLVVTLLFTGCVKLDLDHEPEWLIEAETISMDTLISITIIGSNGHPISGAAITLSNTRETTRQEKITNSEGIAIFDKLNGKDRYNILIKAKGYQQWANMRFKITSHRNTSIRVKLTDNSSVKWH